MDITGNCIPVSQKDKKSNSCLSKVLVLIYGSLDYSNVMMMDNVAEHGQTVQYVQVISVLELSCQVNALHVVTSSTKKFYPHCIGMCFVSRPVLQSS